MSEFTKGSWVVDDIWVNDHQSRICRSDRMTTTICYLPKGKPRSSFNAQLIASAPDLYEALCDMVSDRHELRESTVKFAEKALAKARGEV